MKALVVNSDSLQLKTDASFLNKYGLSILIANDLILSGKLALEKKPEIILLYLNKDEHETGNILLESLRFFSGLIILTVSKNFTLTGFNPKQFELILLDENSTTVDLVSNLCHKYLEEKAFSGENNETAVTLQVPILIVEDNKLNQLYYCEILNKLNLNYVLSEGFVEALSTLEKENFKLLIVDAVLKDGNGIELIQKLKPDSGIATIVVSGYSQQELTKAFDNFVCDVCLTKPIKEEDFSNAIIKCLGLKKNNNPLKSLIKYDYQEMFSLLKYDETKIKTSLNEFLGILRDSIQLTESCMKSKDYECLRQIFHDMLNLSAYYGANLLFDLVMQFKQLEKESEKEITLLKIEKEQQSVFLFYSELLNKLDESILSLKANNSLI
ncbi:MAG: response regulator [Bacteroidota bacterium]|nr:response regulator [Bacteroidota bacterium]